jgi:hypothetical protein
MAVIATPPKLQFFDTNGNPLVGGKLYSYAAGTVTPLATFTDAGGGTPNANPVILDSRGEASVWLGSALYKIALYTSTDVLVWTVDNLNGFQAVTLVQLAASGGSALVGYLPAGTGVATTTVQSKLRESVSVEDFGAVGDGTTDDTAAIIAALASGVKVIYGTPGKTYLVSHTATVSINGTAYRYCIRIPTGVTLDLRGATIKSANSQNSSVVAMFSGSDSGLLNAVIDCNKANQTTPSTGEIAGLLVYSNTRPIVNNVRAINCRQYAGRFLANTGGQYDQLWCTDSDADGWSFGVTGVSGELREVDMTVGSAYAENCTQVYGGGYQGNPVIVTALRAKIGSLSGKNCAGGLKIQDMADSVTVDQITVSGPTNGTVNSGLKVQGNGSGLQPQRVKIGSVNVVSAYGNGLYIADVLSVQISMYHGVTNGGGAAATGSDKHDVNIDVPTGGRVLLGTIDADTPASQCGRVQGAGYCKIDTFFGKTPTGIGLSYTGTNELVIDDLRINDSGSGMTYAFRATGGKGRISRASTDKTHSTSQSRFTVDSGIYNWKIDEIQLGSTDVLEGAVTLTNAATSTSVTCGHIWKDYVGGVSDNFAPLIDIIPINPSARALNSMYAVPVAGSVGTGFAIKHAVAGAADNVFWRVSGWKTISKDIT